MERGQVYIGKVTKITTDEVLKRDWSKDKVTGGTNACHKGGEHEWELDSTKGWKRCKKCTLMTKNEV